MTIYKYLTRHISPSIYKILAQQIQILETPEDGKVEGKNDTNLRVAVKGGGCSGLTYVLELADKAKENEKIITENGLELYVDKKSYIFLAGTTLEYQGGLNGKGFVFNNPNAKTTCGCGTSFSV